MRKKYQICMLIIGISCLFVFLPLAGYGAGLVIGNDVTVNGDLFVTAQSPFSASASGTINIGWINTQLVLGVIPAGERLVIEHVAVRCLTDTDDSIPEVKISAIQKTGPSSWTIHQVPVLAQMQGTTYDGKASWVVSQQVRLYSDGGSGNQVTVDIRHSKTAASASCYAHVSGYAVNTP